MRKERLESVFKSSDAGIPKDLKEFLGKYQDEHYMSPNRNLQIPMEIRPIWQRLNLPEDKLHDFMAAQTALIFLKHGRALPQYIRDSLNLSGKEPIYSEVEGRQKECLGAYGMASMLYVLAAKIALEKDDVSRAQMLIERACINNQRQIRKAETETGTKHDYSFDFFSEDIHHAQEHIKTALAKKAKRG